MLVVRDLFIQESMLTDMILTRNLGHAVHYSKSACLSLYCSRIKEFRCKAFYGSAVRALRESEQISLSANLPFSVPAIKKN